MPGNSSSSDILACSLKKSEELQLQYHAPRKVLIFHFRLPTTTVQELSLKNITRKSSSFTFA
jgi:hypothetical protein